MKAAFKLQSSCVFEKCSKRKDVLGLLPTGFGKKLNFLKALTGQTRLISSW